MQGAEKLQVFTMAMNFIVIYGSKHYGTHMNSYKTFGLSYFLLILGVSAVDLLSGQCPMWRSPSSCGMHLSMSLKNYPVNIQKTMENPPSSIGTSTISMGNFNSYVKLPEGRRTVFVSSCKSF